LKPVYIELLWGSAEEVDFTLELILRIYVIFKWFVRWR